MKKVYVKPDLIALRIDTQLMSTSQGNMGFEGEIDPDEMESKENVWDDFSGFSSFNDNTWGDTWKEEE